MPKMEKHYVEFYSPGTFTPEVTAKEIPSWDVELAKKIAGDIHERHGARPFGFRFFTRTRDAHELDSRRTADSGTYYLGGRVETIEDVRRRADPREEILLGNMERNGIDRIIINSNSWVFTGEFRDGDTLLDFAFPPRAEAEKAG